MKMSLKDMFDNFFNSHHSGRTYSGLQNPSDEMENDPWSSNPNHSNSFHFGMNLPHGNDIFKMIEDFMNEFDRDYSNFPAFPVPGNDAFNQHQSSNQKSLRDQVLKAPDEPSSSSQHGTIDDDRDQNTHNHHPETSIDSMMKDFFGRSFLTPFMEDSFDSFPRQDTDLDERVESGGLDSILKQDGKSTMNEGRLPSFGGRLPSFRSMSESRSLIRRADGSTEQRITRRNADGSEETTVIKETPSGERTTEVRRNDGNVEIIDESSPEDNFGIMKPKPKSEYHQPFFTDTMFSSINSFVKYFFSK